MDGGGVGGVKTYEQNGRELERLQGRGESGDGGRLHFKARETHRST